MSIDWKRFQIAFSRRWLTGGRSCWRNSFRSIWPFCVVSNCWNNTLISSSFLMSSFSNWIVARNSSKVMRPEWSLHGRAKGREIQKRFEWRTCRRLLPRSIAEKISIRSDCLVVLCRRRCRNNSIRKTSGWARNRFELSEEVNDLFFSLLVDVGKHIVEKYSFPRRPIASDDTITNVDINIACRCLEKTSGESASGHWCRDSVNQKEQSERDSVGWFIL